MDCCVTEILHAIIRSNGFDSFLKRLLSCHLLLASLDGEYDDRYCCLCGEEEASIDLWLLCFAQMVERHSHNSIDELSYFLTKALVFMLRFLTFLL